MFIIGSSAAFYLGEVSPSNENKWKVYLYLVRDQNQRQRYSHLMSAEKNNIKNTNVVSGERNCKEEARGKDENVEEKSGGKVEKDGEKLRSKSEESAKNVQRETGGRESEFCKKGKREGGEGEEVEDTAGRGGEGAMEKVG